MGLHSGLVVVAGFGQGSRQHATAVGAPLHLALNIQQHAAPGTILLSAATHALTHTEVRAEPCATLDIAGHPEPVYTLQEMVGRHAGVTGRGPRAQSPFVGRERELSFLTSAWLQYASGRAR